MSIEFLHRCLCVQHVTDSTFRRNFVVRLKHCITVDCTRNVELTDFSHQPSPRHDSTWGASLDDILLILNQSIDCCEFIGKIGSIIIHALLHCLIYCNGIIIVVIIRRNLRTIRIMIGPGLYDGLVFQFSHNNSSLLYLRITLQI